MNKKIMISALAFFFCGALGTWAQTDLTPNDDKTVWTATMPAYDIELQAEYYTDLVDEEVNDYSAFGSEPADIWFGRTLMTGSYNTFAAPFNIDADKLAALGITSVKQLESSSFEGEVLTLNFQDATSIEAGKPYLVKVAANVENPTFDGVIVSGTPATVETASVDFIPTLGATTIPGAAKSVLFLGAANTLYNPSADNQRMKGFRAYFQMKGESVQNARSFRIDWGDGVVTGIQTIAAEGAAKVADGTYTLDGRRIQGQPTAKGVYIQNGKKIIVK